MAITNDFQVYGSIFEKCKRQERLKNEVLQKMISLGEKFNNLEFFDFFLWYSLKYQFDQYIRMNFSGFVDYIYNWK